MEGFVVRKDILNILKKRHLKMSHIETLNDNELLRIYKTFVVPLARREPSSQTTNGNSVDEGARKHAHKRSFFTPMDVDTPPATPPSEQGLSTDLYEKFTRPNSVPPDDCLSSAAKRIKIDST